MPAATTPSLTRVFVTFLAVFSTFSLPVWSIDRPNEGPQTQATARPTASPSPVAADGLAGLLARSRSAADVRNQAALTLCTSEITAVLDRQFADLSLRAESAAAEVATYKHCIKIIAMLASDRVRGRSDAPNWVRIRIERSLEPQIIECQQEIQAVLDRFDRELAASTLTMAAEIAAIGATGSMAAAPDYAQGLQELSLDAALGKLGFDGAVLSPAIAVDVWTLLHSRIVRWMITKAIDTAKWIFARPLAAAVAEAGLVVADGPLPIGDAIAVLAAAWTAYDIYALRNHFEQELTAAVRESLPEARQDMEQQIWAVLRERVASHAEAQARIHEETSRTLLP